MVEEKSNSSLLVKNQQWRRFFGSMLGVMSKNTLQEIIENYNYEKDKMFVPFGIQYNNIPADNTRTKLSMPNFQLIKE